MSLISDYSDQGIEIFFSHYDCLITARLLRKESSRKNTFLSNCQIKVNADLVGCASRSHHCGVLRVEHSKSDRKYILSLDQSNHMIFNNYFSKLDFPIEIPY